MPEYKLQYFQFRGKGEFIRYMFHYKGIPFEDAVIDNKVWPPIKESKIDVNNTKHSIPAAMPMHQLPVLYVDDKFLCQSQAIGDYLGRELGNTHTHPHTYTHAGLS